MFFSIKDTVYHSSFAQHIAELQKSVCFIAAVNSSDCAAASRAVTNPDYVYSRRLLQSKVVKRLAQAKIEGVFIADVTNSDSTSVSPPSPPPADHCRLRSPSA